MTALGVNQARGSILRYLSQHPEGSTTGQIMHDLGLVRITVFRHLAELQELGLVVTHGGEAGRGARVRYSVNAARLSEALEDFANLLEGR